MIIGSGLLASAFPETFLTCADVCIYAAGVSNSGCKNPGEFSRERLRLVEALQKMAHVNAFVYFGTCSVDDPQAQNTAYVLHKLEMEALVAAHPKNLILRLPQVAGKTSNPHTLLNFLYACISRSESFNLWRGAERNIIDVSDVVAISRLLISNSSIRNSVINIANVVSYPMMNIVDAMEHIIGKKAIYTIVEKGTRYSIDTNFIFPFLRTAGVEFGSDYLEKVISKYYKKDV